MKTFLGVAVLALLVGGCGDKTNGNSSSNVAGVTQGPAIKAPNGDWTEMVSETPEGGFVMGNPNAPVKLVEYGSLTCSHCAEFSEAGSEPLKNDYVKTGRVSWEFRPYLLFPTDPGVSMLLRCQGAGPFFALTEQLYADQAAWSGRLQSLAPAQIQQIQSLPPLQAAAGFVKAGGLDEFFRARGMPQAKIDSCLADQAGLDRLAQMSTKAAEDGLTGTPTFFINSKILEDTSDWTKLEPQLKAAGG